MFRETRAAETDCYLLAERPTTKQGTISVIRDRNNKAILWLLRVRLLNSPLHNFVTSKTVETVKRLLRVRVAEQGTISSLACYIGFNAMVTLEIRQKSQIIFGDFITRLRNKHLTSDINFAMWTDFLLSFPFLPFYLSFSFSYI